MVRSKVVKIWKGYYIKVASPNGVRESTLPILVSGVTSEARVGGYLLGFRRLVFGARDYSILGDGDVAVLRTLKPIMEWMGEERHKLIELESPAGGPSSIVDSDPIVEEVKGAVEEAAEELALELERDGVNAVIHVRLRTYGGLFRANEICHWIAERTLHTFGFKIAAKVSLVPVALRHYKNFYPCFLRYLCDHVSDDILLFHLGEGPRRYESKEIITMAGLLTGSLDKDPLSAVREVRGRLGPFVLVKSHMAREEARLIELIKGKKAGYLVIVTGDPKNKKRVIKAIPRNTPFIYVLGRVPLIKGRAPSFIGFLQRLPVGENLRGADATPYGFVGGEEGEELVEV